MVEAYRETVDGRRRRRAFVGGLGRPGWIGLWAALFIGVALLVQARYLSALDEMGLRLVADLRPASLADVMNWVFRLGFVQVDAAIALVWAAALLAKRRSLQAALPPLVLFLAIGFQAGLRLVVDQPAPGNAYALNRRFAAQPVGYALDRADFAAREAFVAATSSLAPATGDVPAQKPGAGTAAAGVGAAGRERGSFPSGHATRALFLALLAASSLGRRVPLVGLVVLAGAIGYSATYFGYHWPSDVVGGYVLAVPLYYLAVWLGDARRGLVRHPAERVLAGAGRSGVEQGT